MVSIERLYCSLGCPVLISISTSIDDEDYLLKMIVIGEAGSGKTCCVHQFIHDSCESQPGSFRTVYLGARQDAKLIIVRSCARLFFLQSKNIPPIQ